MPHPSRSSSRSSSRSDEALDVHTSSRRASDAEGTPSKTFSGLTLRVGKVPNNSARNFMRCTSEACTASATKACTSRRCAAHCSTEFTGKKCSVHKGTKAQPVNPDELPSPSSAPQKQGTHASSTPSKQNKGRQAGPKPSRGQGITFSRNLDQKWMAARDSAEGFAVADRSAQGNMAQIYFQQQAQKVTVWLWEKVCSIPLCLSYCIPR